MTGPRRVALAALAAGLLGVLAGPAHAEGFVTAPTEPVTAHGAVTVTGDVDAAERDRLELRIGAPGQSPQVVAQLGPAATTDSARTLSASLDTATCGIVAVCGRGTAANGTYAVDLLAVRPPELGSEERVLATGSFVVDVPARVPAEVAAEVTAPRQVTVSWARGTEPDLRGWQVGDGAGRTQTVAPAACDGDTCATAFSYGAGDSGARTYSVVATRACAGADCDPVPSVAASTGPVDIATAGQTSGDGTPPPGSPPPGATGGVGRADTRSLDFGLGDFGPTSDVPSIPEAAPVPPAVAGPELADTFEGTLGFDERVTTVPEVLDEPAVEASGRDPAVATVTGGPLSDEQLVSSVAGALLLVLLGAHLRAWLARGGGS